MIKLKNSVRKLSPYRVNDVPYKVKLDANEGQNYLLDSSFDLLKDIAPNIYPDSDSKLLRKNMANYYKCDKENIIVGNGSSDLINMVINAYCEKNDIVLSFVPSFSMYKTYCDLCSAKFETVSCDEGFSQNIELLIERAETIKPKVVILCNPNNPTGYLTPREDIIRLLDKINDAVIIVDEAYIEFGGESVVDLINKYDNLIVMRTLSKAFGLAALRVGCLIANEGLVKVLWSVKVPYNLNAFSQLVANKAFEKIELVQNYVKDIANQRESLSKDLKSLGFGVYSSGANFILIKSNIDDLFLKLKDKGILIRNFSGNLTGYYRVTVGNKVENRLLIKTLKEIINNEN